MSIYRTPRGRANVIEFFGTIGQHAADVLADNITSEGYYTFLLDAHGNRTCYLDGIYHKEFHPWPNGHDDWERFVEASRKDNLEGFEK